MSNHAGGLNIVWLMGALESHRLRNRETVCVLSHQEKKQLCSSVSSADAQVCFLSLLFDSSLVFWPFVRLLQWVEATETC